MRWKQKPKPPEPPQPKPGDTRYVERFLWWPVTLQGETRWLERARILQAARTISVCPYTNLPLEYGFEDTYFSP